MESHSFEYPLTELHAHLGASINSSIYWRSAQAQGFKLSTRDYDEFIDFITLSSWPEVIPDTHLWRQYEMLVHEDILSKDELLSCTEIAEKASFIKKAGIDAYL